MSAPGRHGINRRCHSRHRLSAIIKTGFLTTLRQAFSDWSVPVSPPSPGIFSGGSYGNQAPPEPCRSSSTLLGHSRVPVTVRLPGRVLPFDLTKDPRSPVTSGRSIRCPWASHLSPDSSSEGRSPAAHARSSRAAGLSAAVSAFEAVNSRTKERRLADHSVKRNQHPHVLLPIDAFNRAS